MYLTFVMDIKRTAGSYAALGAALFFGSGTPPAKILLADVSPLAHGSAPLPERTPVAYRFGKGAQDCIIEL
ncbi:MAG TPA: hypothetical protein VFN62_02725 [Acidobacteriaceae bacterium]|nr:hypothetical protein [Acidobacteriaceae bacterium]